MDDVIVVGAGAAGLAAARLLSKEKAVTILEARDRIGGRIYTIKGEGFSFPVEAGAEFMHGELPNTKALMTEAKVSYYAGDGRTWNVQNNDLSEGDLFHEDWHILMHKLQQISHDMTIGRFLALHFGDPKYQSLSESIIRFVEGYDAADINKASALSLREEWSNENIKGYRPKGGYSQLTDFLLKEIQKHNGILKLSTVVKRIIWKSNYVKTITDNGEAFEAKNILVTVPVSVLKSGRIEFDPPLQEHRVALDHLEMGGVIKFLVEFKDRFWERPNASDFRRMPDLNFIFSDARVPTWWTQNPNGVPLLTGWLAGPVIQQMQQDNDGLLTLGLESLGYLFGASEQQIMNEVKAAKVVNWKADPYAQGAYAYTTLETSKGVKVLSKPVEKTIYFAGEALYEGAEMGTVEAALVSGKLAAEKINSDNL
jgi:monoamine oxidase